MSIVRALAQLGVVSVRRRRESARQRHAMRLLHRRLVAAQADVERWRS